LNHGLISAHIFVASLSAIGILLTFILGRDHSTYEVGRGAALIYAISPIRVKMAGDIMVDALPSVF
jgi:4-amino-4-deoxy-L-arabinose transferase-like glycosyltransferase